MDKLEQYIQEHTTSVSSLLEALERETHLRVVQPRMISGPLQGKLLEMLVRMIRPKRILEIGTFTGYSAICMAHGMEGGEVHTIEIDDELAGISSKYFDLYAQTSATQIIPHIGSALDVAPRLGLTFDLIFIDGDKREYPAYYDMAMSGLVNEGGYLLADNILWYGKVVEPTPANDLFTAGIKQFNDLVQADERVENVILPIRDGLNLVRIK